MLEVSKKVNFNNFGYIPKDSFLQNVYGKCFGYPNLYKRLQAKDIFEVLDIKQSDVILDLGCGTGYFTIEMSKQARKAIGADIDELVNKIKVPEKLQEKLAFVHVQGEDLPFDNNSMDIVFCSEVIGQLPEPSALLMEIKRVLKPKGRFVLVNGCGHPHIKKLYKEKPAFFNNLKNDFPERFPQDYNAYSSALNKQFSNIRSTFFSLNEIRGLLEKHGFAEKSFRWSPGKKFGEYFSKNMFEKFVKTGSSYKKSPFDYIKFIFQYHYFKNEGKGEKNYESGLIYEAVNSSSMFP